MSAVVDSSLGVQKKIPRAPGRTLLLILVLTALPVLVATSLYFGAWRPAKTDNYGELIPPSELPDMPLIVDGKPMRLAGLKERWTMVYVGFGPCEAACLKNMFLMRQIHSGFNKDAHRIQEMLIALDGLENGGLGETRKEYPHTRVVTGPSESLAILAKKLGGSGAAGRMYLIDPRGFVMMRYPADPKPAGIKQDLERLLKHSWVG